MNVRFEKIMGITFLAVFLIFPTYSFGQQPATLSSTIERCNVSVSYPAEWTPVIKTGRFDTTSPLEFAVFKPGGYPMFSLFACSADVPDPGAISLYDLGNYAQQQMTTNYNPNYTISVVEGNHIIKGLINAQEVAVFALLYKYADHSIGTETYILIHGNKVYRFDYFDLPTNFDSPENKAIRDKILHSIRFLS